MSDIEQQATLLLARVLAEHHRTKGMAVSMGVTCKCGYWTHSKKIPGVSPPNYQMGDDGLDYHRAEVLMKVLNG